ncbi:OmpA family protein [Sediminibacterium soli]|uniref:OmpA family protein n=1 Tax=Sediminibacterium soli TaxID=2698829 RepID=UPI00137B6034|nr:OmpA family protein [Sediminibacterium soli]NCI45882.1 OmpA family protein [Sediminibacterium soli]
MRKLMLILGTTAFMFCACKNMSKTQKGILIGAGAGAAVGAGIGKAANNNTALGAILGAAVGGVAGGLIGKKMDQQAKEIAQIPGADVKRVGEGINVTFDSGVLFETNSAGLNSAAKENLAKLTDVLNKYPDTYVRVEGHTDNTGSTEYNLGLSEKRAKEVSNYLALQKVKTDRIKTAWYGEAQPKADNDTESGRALNRRVEFAIYANETMKEQAKQESSNTK